jgi:hypothetical protein
VVGVGAGDAEPPVVLGLVLLPYVLVPLLKLVLLL